MSSRREVKQQVSEMRAEIRRLALDRNLSPGEMLPSVRELAQQYGISYSLVAQSLKALADEGIIYSVPRVGSFLGRPHPNQAGVYLLLVDVPQANLHCAPVQTGFEERIAQLGGACLTLDRRKASVWEETGQIPTLAGVFAFDEIEPPPGLWDVREAVEARVQYGEINPAEPGPDMVYFDNVKGGQQATQHLLSLGHHQIAFLGLLGIHDDLGQQRNFLWSQEREDGWRMALESSGHSTTGLLFRPDVTPTIGAQEQIQAARQASEHLIREERVTAVVATNSYAARSLFQALQAANVPGERWPAVVCFDTTNLDGLDAHITALRMPWEDLGRAAADLLWERSHGQWGEAPQQRLVPMRLITRLTCRPKWARNAQNSSDQNQALQIHQVVA